MFLIIHICDLNALPLNPLSMFGNSPTLWILVGGRNCLNIKKLQTPALSILLSARDLGVVSDRDLTWTSSWQLVTQGGDQERLVSTSVGRWWRLTSRLTSDRSHRKGDQGRPQCSGPAGSTLEVSTRSSGTLFLSRWLQVRFCVSPRNSVNYLISFFINPASS